MACELGGKSETIWKEKFSLSNEKVFIAAFRCHSELEC